jgi:hypothetical protein
MDQGEALPELLTARIIRERIVPCGKRTFQRWLAAGDFPESDVHIGGTHFWRRDTVLTFVENRERRTGPRN